MAAKIGVDPIHFAMVVIFNLTLGMITPPVGGLLFVTSNVSKVPLTALTRELKLFFDRSRDRFGAFDLRAGIVKLAASCHGFQIITLIIHLVRRVSELINQVRPPKAQAVQTAERSGTKD